LCLSPWLQSIFLSILFSHELFLFSFLSFFLLLQRINLRDSPPPRPHPRGSLGSDSTVEGKGKLLHLISLLPTGPSVFPSSLYEGPVGMAPC
jgi:hypothetical protein